MVNWDQFVRNLAYGAVHRPAQVVRWLGGFFPGEAAPVGAGLTQLAAEMEAEALATFQPSFPPVSQVPTGSPRSLSNPPRHSRQPPPVGTSFVAAYEYDPASAAFVILYTVNYEESTWPGTTWEGRWPGPWGGSGYHYGWAVTITRTR